MLKTSNTFIAKATLQRVGNKLSQEMSHVTNAEIPLTESEEELLKNFFLKCSQNQSLSRHIPDIPSKNHSLKILTKKPILPSASEIKLLL
mgnify:CR=1 FL=1